VAAVLRVLKYAKAKGLTAASAADIREDMSHLLPHVNGAKRHFTAVDYKDVPTFVRELRAAQTQGDALSPSVIEFILLTAARENEACGMQWSEIDCQERLWTLPLVRDKTGDKRPEPRRIPLCDRALVLLSRQRGPSLMREPPEPHGYVWPGRSGDAPVTGKSVYKYLVETMGVNATIHGFRSSFRGWAGDEITTPAMTSRNALDMPWVTQQNAPIGAKTPSTSDGQLWLLGPRSAKAAKALTRVRDRGWRAAATLA
jgi:integrase